MQINLKKDILDRKVVQEFNFFLQMLEYGSYRWKEI